MPVITSRTASDLARSVKGRISRTRRRISRGIHSRRRPADGETGRISPENLVWIFGSARTGSTWLGAMMADLKGHAWWHEPLVGYLFGHLYYERARARREDDHFILGGDRDLWLGPVRRFVLDSASTRFPELIDKGYLVIKEPHGTLGAPLLTEALPESRMILLVRDPRDVISSKMDAAREGSWAEEAQKRRGQEKKNTSADRRPDAFVKSQARRYVQLIDLAQQAYDSHNGRKVLVRYEDLRAEPLETMRRIYASLEIPVEEWDLARVVEKHAWENIPDRKKGSGKFYRKGSPGGWAEDLTPEQVEIVEGITAPILDRYYAEDRQPRPTG
ncbi:MAG TPA: sulfotransferase [Rubrobacter sp.]